MEATGLLFIFRDKFVMTIVVLNAVVLVIHEFYDPHSIWFWIDYACVVFFTVEIAYKIHCFAKKGAWWSSWDVFDTIIVVLSLPILLMPFLAIPDLSGILVLRLGRFFRLFRLMRFIPDSSHLVQGIRRALKASIGVFLGLILFNLILGLVAALIFGKTAPEHFGDPAIAFYTMFKVFTVEGWFDIPEMLLQLEAFQSTGWQLFIRVFFGLAVVFGGILGFSLVNAVFVDEMVMDNNQGLEQRLEAMGEELRLLRLHLERKGRLDS